MTFIGSSSGLMEMLKIATNRWRPHRRHEAQTYLVSIVLAIETLGSDFAGWGSQCPDAKRKADQILCDYFGANHTRLLDVYMPLRAQLQEDKVKEALGPASGEKDNV